MPTVTSPLFSISAHGTVARSMNFKRTKRGHICRVHSQPSGEPSDNQLLIRAITKQVAQSWAFIEDADRETWQQLASASNFSPYNAFFVTNFNRVRNGDVITRTWPLIIPFTGFGIYSLAASSFSSFSLRSISRR